MIRVLLYGQAAIFLTMLHITCSAQVTPTIDWEKEAYKQVRQALEQLDGFPVPRLPVGDLNAAAKSLDAGITAARKAQAQEILAKATFLRACVRWLQGEYIAAYRSFQKLSEDQTVPMKWSYLATSWMEIVARERRLVAPYRISSDSDEIDAMGYDPKLIRQESASRERKLSTRMSKDPKNWTDYGSVVLVDRILEEERTFINTASLLNDVDNTIPNLHQAVRHEGEKLLTTPWNERYDLPASQIGINLKRALSQRELWAAELFSRIGDLARRDRIIARLMIADDSVTRILSKITKAELLLAPTHGLATFELPSIHTNFSTNASFLPTRNLARSALSEENEHEAWRLLKDALAESQDSGKRRLEAEVLLRTALLRLVRAAESTRSETQETLLRLAREELRRAEFLFRSVGDVVALRRVLFGQVICSVEQGEFNEAKRAMWQTNNAEKDGLSLGFGRTLQAVGWHALVERGDTVRGFALLHLSRDLFADAGALLAAARTALGIGQLEQKLGTPSRAFWTYFRGRQDFRTAINEGRYLHRLTTVEIHDYTLSFVTEMATTVTSSFNQWRRPKDEVVSIVLNELETELRVAAHLLDIQWPQGVSTGKALQHALQQLQAKMYIWQKFIHKQNSVGKSAVAAYKQYSQKSSLARKFRQASIVFNGLRYLVALDRANQSARNKGYADYSELGSLLEEAPNPYWMLALHIVEKRCHKLPSFFAASTGPHIASIRSSPLPNDVKRKHIASRYMLNIEYLLQCKLPIEASIYASELKKLIGNRNTWARTERDAWRHFEAIGRTELGLNRFSDALAWLKLAETNLAHRRRIFIDEVSRKATVRSADNLFGSIVEALLELGQQNQNPEYFKEAFIWVERAKARSFIESLLINRQLTSRVEDKSVLSRWYQTAARQESLAQRAFELTNMDTKLSLRIRDTEEQLRQLTQQIAAAPNSQESRILRTIRDSPPPKIQVIAGSIPADGIFVQYFLYRDTIYIWTLDSSGNLTSTHRPLSQSELFKQSLPPRTHIASARILLSLLVRNYVAYIANGDKLVYIKKQREVLSDILIQPIAKQLRRKQRVIISGHGFLHNLPFELLELDKKLLYEFKDISYLPNAASAVLLNSKSIKRSHSKRSPAYSAYFVYEDRVPLWRTGLQALASVYPNPKKMEVNHDNNNILVKDINRALRKVDYNVMHFALHGEILPEDPGRAGLVVSSLSPKRYLTDFDVLALDLQGLGVIMLASCGGFKSGLSFGDELSSLVRSFHVAGAHNVVASLWRLNSSRTGDLLKAFYNEYHTHGDAVRALAEAKRKYVEQNPGYFAHPEHWAALIISGI